MAVLSDVQSIRRKKEVRFCLVPYLITFLISILLCGCAELVMRHSRTGGVLLLGAAVLPPVFLAGARDFTVGTDVQAYGNYVFTYARFSENPISFMWRKSDIEPFYKGLAAFVSRFTDNPHWFYFATALVICGCIMGGLYHYRRSMASSSPDTGRSISSRSCATV